MLSVDKSSPAVDRKGAENILGFAAECKGLVGFVQGKGFTVDNTDLAESDCRYSRMGCSSSAGSDKSVGFENHIDIVTDCVGTHILSLNLQQKLF